MTLQVRTIRPGYLVRVKTSVEGGVKYLKEIVESDHVVEETGANEETWTTTRIVSDKKEHEAAKKVRSKAAAIIRGVCIQSGDFGLLCPIERREALDKAIDAAKQVAREFNRGAQVTRVKCYALTGYVAENDAKAIEAINSEVKDLLDTMVSGLENLDVKKVRDGASRVKAMANMLTPEMEARVQISVDAAREAAKKLVKAGTVAAMEVDRVAIRKITEMRTAFLDLEGEDVVAPVAQAGRAVDLPPEEEKKPDEPDDGIKKPKPAAARQLEI